MSVSAAEGTPDASLDPPGVRADNALDKAPRRADLVGEATASQALDAVDPDALQRGLAIALARRQPISYTRLQSPRLVETSRPACVPARTQTRPSSTDTPGPSLPVATLPSLPAQSPSASQAPANLTSRSAQKRPARLLTNTSSLAAASFGGRPPCILPSFALQEPQQASTGAVLNISGPLITVSDAALARILGSSARQSGESIFDIATHQSPAALKHHLSVHPRAVLLWRLRGDNLLHHVIRHCTVAHIDVVIGALKQLEADQRCRLLDGVAEDGLDAVRLAIRAQAPFVLAKLLDVGCTPSRRRYRRQLVGPARLAQPQVFYPQIEDAAIYALRESNADAVDLLLLWDDRRRNKERKGPYVFDLDQLMAIAAFIKTASLRDACIDVLHAAQSRRLQRKGLDLQAPPLKEILRH